MESNNNIRGRVYNSATNAHGMDSPELVTGTQALPFGASSSTASGPSTPVKASSKPSKHLASKSSSSSTLSLAGLAKNAREFVMGNDKIDRDGKPLTMPSPITSPAGRQKSIRRMVAAGALAFIMLIVLTRWTLSSTSKSGIGKTESPLRHASLNQNRPRPVVLADGHDPEVYEESPNGAAELARQVALIMEREKRTNGKKSLADTEPEEARKKSDYAWKPKVDGQGGVRIIEQAFMGQSDHVDDDTNAEILDSYGSLTDLEARRAMARRKDRHRNLSPDQVEAQLELEEKNRVASLRALTAFVTSGGTFPESWAQESSSSEANELSEALQASWKAEKGNGLEGPLRKLLGDRWGNKIFHANWIADADAKRVVVYSKVSLAN